MKNTYLAVATALLVAAGASADMRISPQRTTLSVISHVPVTLESGMTVVEVRIGVKGPYRFAIDTGIKPALVIDQSLASLLLLEHRGTLGANEVVQIDRLTLGKAKFSGLDAIVDNVRANYHVDGLIGFGMFRDLLLTIDYPNSEIRMRTGALSAVDGKSVVDLKQFDGVPAVVVKAGEQYRFVSISTGPRTIAMANVGYDFLKRNVITFDAAHQRVAIDPAS